jgi:hypothetical protein
MMMSAFWRLHYYLGGGKRRLLAMIAIYVALIVGGWYLMFRISSDSWLVANQLPTLPAAERDRISSQTSRAMLGWVAGSQALFLLIMTPAMIRKAIQTDFQTGMIESHRLSPMSGLRIVWGYLAAAPLQAFALYGASLALGGYFAMDAMRVMLLSPLNGLQMWMSGQVLLLSLALLSAAATALFSLHNQGKMGRFIFPFVFIGLMLGGTIMLRLAPGIGLLIGFIAAQVIFNALRGAGGLASVTGAVSQAAPVMLLSMGAQLLASGILIAAAARKIRRPDSSLLGLPLGLAITLILSAATIAGMAYAGVDDELAASPQTLLAYQLGASLLLLLFVSYFALVAAAEEQVAADRAAHFGEHRPGYHRLYQVIAPAGLSLLLSAVVLASIYVRSAAIPDEEVGRLTAAMTGHGAIFVAILAHMVTDFAFCGWLLSRSKKTFAPMLMAFVFLRIAPLVLDNLRPVAAAILSNEELPANEYTPFFSHLSSLGTAMMCLGQRGSPWIGVVIQCAIAVAVAILWARSRHLAPSRPQRPDGDSSAGGSQPERTVVLPTDPTVAGAGNP